MAKASAMSVEGIRRTILQGAWSPGERLQPATLATHFDTSSTVIRESLTRLAGEGLVLLRPNRGFFVAELKLRELADITELRCVTEALAARLSVERGDLAWESALIAAHHQLVRTPRRCVDDPDQVNAEWARAHRDFHLKLLEASDCQPMIRLASNLADSTELYRRWAAPSPAAAGRSVEREHELLLEAALARDAGALARRLREHYEATVQVVMDAGLAEAAAAG
ncbi:GntR family transcriptional regulator [Paeniglutamicibacter sp. NPDC091659]|uniref:GntR family transcriptional regulator n=1 Tax=Paeniglutamicibacter sp. NPDC091659 TaxID=3364389 RepID=UPI0037F2B5E0